MVLEPLQQQHLSRLETGQAVVFNQGWKSSVLTQIEPNSTTQADIPLDEIEPKLRYRVWEFYQLSNNLHVLPLKAQQSTSAIEQWQEQMSFSSDIKLLSAYTKYMDERSEKNHEHLKSLLNMAVDRLGSASMVIEHLLHHLYIPYPPKMNLLVSGETSYKLVISSYVKRIMLKLFVKKTFIPIRGENINVCWID